MTFFKAGLTGLYRNPGSRSIPVWITGTRVGHLRVAIAAGHRLSRPGTLGEPRTRFARLLGPAGGPGGNKVACIHTYIYIYVHIHVFTYIIQMCAYTHIYTRINRCLCKHIAVYVFSAFCPLHAHLYTYHISIHIYIYCRCALTRSLYGNCTLTSLYI